MKSKVVSLLIIVAGFFASACRGDLFPKLEPQNAITFGQQLGTSAAESASAYGPQDVNDPVGQSTASLTNGGANAARPTACQDGGSVTIEGDITDADADTIPVDATITVADCTYVGPFNTWIANGSVSAQDIAPDEADFNFDWSHDITLLVDNNANDSAIERSAVRALEAREDNGEYTLSDTHTIDLVVTQANGRQSTAGNDGAWRVVYVPSAEWTPGQELASGDFSINGSWNLRFNEREADADLTTVDTLVIDSTCDSPSRLVGGSLRAEWEGLQGSQTIQVEWTGCETYNVLLDGEVIGNQDGLDSGEST